MRLTRPEYREMERFIDDMLARKERLTPNIAQDKASELVSAAFQDEGLDPGEHMAAFSMEVSALLLWGQWYLQDKRIVVLPPALTADFLRSDINEILLRDLLPQEETAFYLHLSQPGKPGLALGAGLLEGVHVQYLPHTALRLEFITRTAGQGGLTRDWRYRYALPVLSAWFDLPAEEAFAAALARELADLDRAARYIAAQARGREVFAQALRKKQEQSAADLPAAARLLANTLAYMRHYPDEISQDWSQKVPERFERQLRSERPTERERTRAKLWSLGIIPVQVLGHVRDTAAKGASVTRESSSPRTHWRRGHWRAQAYGERLQQRKLIYIRPVLVKGSDEKRKEPGE